jgi:hypothetical protein
MSSSAGAHAIEVVAQQVWQQHRILCSLSIVLTRYTPMIWMVWRGGVRLAMMT